MSGFHAIFYHLNDSGREELPTMVRKHGFAHGRGNSHGDAGDDAVVVLLNISFNPEIWLKPP